MALQDLVSFIHMTILLCLPKDKANINMGALIVTNFFIFAFGYNNLQIVCCPELHYFAKAFTIIPILRTKYYNNYNIKIL